MVHPRTFARAARRVFNSQWHVALARLLRIPTEQVAAMEAGTVPISEDAIAAVAEGLRDTVRQCLDRLDEIGMGDR